VAGDLRERVRAEQGRQTYFSVHFRHKFAPFDCLIISCVYCPLKRSFCDIFVIHRTGRKKDLEQTVWEGGNYKFGGIPPKKMPGINTEYKETSMPKSSSIRSAVSIELQDRHRAPPYV